MHKALTIVLISLSLLIGGSATQAQSEPRLKSPSEHIRALKNGVLLVRLQTKNNSIEALINANRVAQAEQLRQKTHAENLDLVQAARTEFKFCPVYFFYSYDSKHVVKSELDSVQFLNDQLEYDPSIRVESDIIYTAELGLIGQDTSAKKRNLSAGEEADPSNREAKYYGGANMRFHAFIIKDNDFRQLRKPFPYYSRTLNSFFIKKSNNEVIRRMNLKLNKFLGD